MKNFEYWQKRMTKNSVDYLPSQYTKNWPLLKSICINVFFFLPLFLLQPTTENLLITKLAMRKKIRPLKYPRENIFDHQIPTRKAFGLTKYSGEKVSFTKSTCLQLLHGLTVLKKFHRISESSDSRQTEAVTAGVLWKEMFLKISQNSQENTFAKVSFLISCRLESCDFIQKQALSQVLIFEFREIFKKNLLQDTFVRLLLKLSSFFVKLHACSLQTYESNSSSAWNVTQKDTSDHVFYKEFFHNSYF